MPLQFIANLREKLLVVQIHGFSLNKTAAENVYLGNNETTLCIITMSVVSVNQFTDPTRGKGCKSEPSMGGGGHSLI